MATVLHRAEGSYTEDGAIWWLIVLGGVGAITMIIVGAIVPEKVGPWWVWTAVLVGIVALAWWALGKGGVVIELVDDGGATRVTVKGKAVAIDEVLESGVEHWCTLERVPVRLGGGHMAHFSVVVRAAGGRRLGFRQMGGSDSAGWPVRDGRLQDGKDVFFTVDIFGLHKALVERAGGRGESDAAE